MAGMFISFEGGEGSGKTTIIETLIKALEAKGYNVVRTREPGGVPIAEQIRNVILDVNNTAMCYETEALLYAAARMQHLKEKVLPAIEKGSIVICDRYLDSSLVYQGFARGIDIENVKNANYFAMKHLPDVTFFIDVTPEVGLKRILGRGEELNRLDKESVDFHQRVYDGYVKLCDMYPERIVRINGEQERDKVAEDVISAVLSKLGK